jgi:hypothetical protein
MTTNNQTRNLLMIGGTGRSGTTLLAKIFNNHPQVAVAPEWRFLIDPDGLLDFIASASGWSPYHYDIKLKRLFSLLYDIADSGLLSKVINKMAKLPIVNRSTRKLILRYHGINAVQYAPNYMEIVNEFVAKLVDFEYEGYWVGTPFSRKKHLLYSSKKSEQEFQKIVVEFLCAIIDDVLKEQNADYYLEKNTWNILWFDKIIELLPKAKLVHIYRDPRDVVASFMRQTWMPSNAGQSAKICRDLLEKWEEIKTLVPVGSYLEISLESLVSEPESILKEICTFWGISWEAKILNTDLSRSNSGRWKTLLTRPEQIEVGAILGEYVKKLGYAAS